MLYNSLVIAGPTGVGKTALSLKLAKILNFEIISADSMQIYKGMDIGTAKIRNDEMQGIKHHMLDVVSPNVDYSVGDYEKAVNRILKDNTKKYMLVGGTGLYISAITDGFSSLPSKDDKLRRELELRDLNDLLEELKVLDIETYMKIDRGNKVRIVRALEVCKLTNSKFSCLNNKNIKNNDYTFYKVFLTRNREELYEIINKRIDNMLENGLLEEARYIHENFPTNKAIGYKELFDYFDGNSTFDKAVELLKRRTRNYAKRQITWFKNHSEYNIYNLSIMSEDEIIKDILKKMR